MEVEKEPDNNESIAEKKEKRVSKNKILHILNIIKSLIILEYCCGIFRFQLVNGVLRPPNWKMITYGILLNLIYTAVFITFVLDDYPVSFIEEDSFMDTVDKFPSVVVLIQYGASIISAAFIVSSTNIQILTTLSDTDTKLQVDRIPEFYRKNRSRLNKFLSLLIISHIINSVVDYLSVSDFVWGLTVLPLYFVQKLEVFVFCSYVGMVNERLAIINGYLKEFNQEQCKKKIVVFTVKDIKAKTKKTFNFIGRPNESNAKIRDLATTYDNLGEMYSMINEVFNFQIFLTLISTFTYIVVTIWTSLYFYRTPEFKSSQLVNVLIWCFSTICNVAIMSFTCERVLLKRNEMKILVNNIIMNYDLPKTMRVQAKAFMELVEAWPLRIYVYDMFSIDITLMLKFISVATTYLIVIIQISHFI